MPVCQSLSLSCAKRCAPFSAKRSVPLYSHSPCKLDSEQLIQVMDELGRRCLTEVYRQLLLGVITELWVDYLTQMEALRVSIGLEAYGQRDPLVQYKSKAFELFQICSGICARV